MRSAPKKKFKTAILFQNGAIGDFLMSLFLAELLRESGCVDWVTIIVPRNVSFLRGLVEGYPYISVVEISRRRGWLQAFKMTRGPTLVIIQPTVGTIPLKVKLVAWLLSRRRGSEYVGFQDKGSLCNTLYSKTLVYNTDQLYSETMQSVVGALGAPVPGQIPSLKIAADDKFIVAYHLDRRRYMVFHPGASVPKRSFTVGAAREVIAHVLKGDPEIHVVLSGSHSEAKWIDQISSGLQENHRIVTAIGCSAREIAALIRSARFFIGTDSGITHLACFLHASVIVAAHSGTTNWLPFYCPSAVVLYRLEEETLVHQTREYLDERRRGRIKPLGTVPSQAICAVVDRFVGGCASEEDSVAEVVWRENGNRLCNPRC